MAKECRWYNDLNSAQSLAMDGFSTLAVIIPSEHLPA